MAAPPYRFEPFGDRINLHRNQIATFEFWEKHLDQLYGYKADIVGGLLGECEGILGAKPHVWDPVAKVIRLHDMVLVAARNENVATVQPHGGVYLYKKTDPHQLNTIVDLSGYEGSSGVIWWSIFSVPTDHGQFLKWKPGFAKGRVVAEKRLRRTRAVFAATASWDSPPMGDGPWFKLASFTYPEDGVPTMKWVSAWDQGSHLGPTSRSNPANRLGLYMQAAQETYPAAPKSFGTARAISLLAHFICAQQSNTYSFDPGTGEVLTPGFGALTLDPSYRGRVELHNDLFAAEGAIADLQAELEGAKARITDLENSPRGALWAAVVQDDAAIYSQQGSILGEGAVTVTPAGTGTYQIDFPRPVDVPASRAIAQATIHGTTLGHVTASWLTTTQLVVQTYDTVPSAAARAFVVSVFGR